jgi:hypothetical protein
MMKNTFGGENEQNFNELIFKEEMIFKSITFVAEKVEDFYSKRCFLKNFLYVNGGTTEDSSSKEKIVIDIFIAWCSKEIHVWKVNTTSSIKQRQQEGRTMFVVSGPVAS